MKGKIYLVMFLSLWAANILTAQTATANFVAYEKAANQGDAEAQFKLGACYYLGEGVLQNFKKAVYWSEKAANKGVAGAQSLLGGCYASGKGVLQDVNKAFYWYEKAANQGYADAQFMLGICYFDGIGTYTNKQKAAYWIKQAYQNGNEMAEKFWNKKELWKYK